MVNETKPRIPVAVAGATGSVGQRFVELLADHPWFEVVALTASERSAGAPYGERVAWVQSTPIPESIARLPVGPTEPESVEDARIVFSALDASAAGPAEVAFARAGHVVVSNAKSHRMHKHVPLLVPEVNAAHVELARTQSYGEGAILTNPNCSTIGLVLTLAPLEAAFGLDAVHVVTMQALSGAGLPGVPSARIVDNVIPFIGGEEEKLETETRKILGRLDKGKIEERTLRVSAQCNRVPVLDGHTACVSVKLIAKASMADVERAWIEFEGAEETRDLPSAPRPPLRVLSGEDHPQPRLHRDLGRGMAASIGRLRACPLFDWKYVTLSHNTIRGAAGGAILVAELAVKKGLVPGVAPVEVAGG